jgi:hypothetical protein
MPAVPDCNGKRYCRACEAFLPLDKFNKTGPRRYYCAFHIQSLFRKRGINKLAVINLRKRLRRDLIRLFGKTVIQMTHNDLLCIIAQANKTPSDYHELSVLPCNPQKPITPQNVFLATKEQRKYLVALYQLTGDISDYERGVRGMHAWDSIVNSQ